MKASTWKIISIIKTVENEFVAMGYDPNSPTPYGTWIGTITDNSYDFYNGNYYETKSEAWNNLIERAERFYL